MKEEVVGEDQGAAKKKIPNGGVADRFSALFTRPIGLRAPLDRIDEHNFWR